jgi:hypothetical protein
MTSSYLVFKDYVNGIVVYKTGAWILRDLISIYFPKAGAKTKEWEICGYKSCIAESQNKPFMDLSYWEITSAGGHMQPTAMTARRIIVILVVIEISSYALPKIEELHEV